MQATLAALLLVAVGSCVAERNLTFPDSFLFGAATASYQVEGAWNTSGKGENIWDRLVHTNPECIANSNNGDFAADSYHKYKEDVKALKEVGFNLYRFSISWTRILPKGDLSVINQDGIDYYNNLINELLANNIQPIVTMYHWDLPQHLQDLGGMTNSAFVEYFEDYANILFTHFGDRVKWWLTFNEPYSIVMGYNTKCNAPGVLAPGVGEYLVIHNMLKAHAKAYHLYDQEFRSTQKGKVGITLSSTWAEPKSQSPADVEAAERYLQFIIGWFAHPIFSKEGDYPAIMKGRIANNSKAEGLRRSRLPQFSQYWINYIRGTHDFFGLNFYSSIIVSASNSSASSSVISIDNDMGPLVSEPDPSWMEGAAHTFWYTPFGLRKMLKWVSDRYNKVDILITENGWPDRGSLNDTMRIRYYVNHLASALDAIYIDKVNLLGHTAWSIIDTFEWTSGYSVKFGLYHIDYNDPDRPRAAKDTAKVYTSIIKNRKLPDSYLDTVN